MREKFGSCIIFTIVLLSNFVLNSADLVKKRSDDTREDNGEFSDDSKDEALDMPPDADSHNITCARRAIDLIHEIRPATPSQFPFVAAILSHRREFLCSATVVSNGMFITSATCLLKPIRYLLLNATKDKREETTHTLDIIKTEKFPSYIAGDVIKNFGIIYTAKHNANIASKIYLSEYTSPKSITFMKAIGYGLNADVGDVRELQYVGLEHRPGYDEGDIIRGYIDCIDTKVVTCFKDTGGPVIHDNKLIGIVTIGTDECVREMTSVYSINKVMTVILPTYIFKAWLDEKIKKNQNKVSVSSLAIYPESPRRIFAVDTPPATMRPVSVLRNSKERISCSALLIYLSFINLYV